MFLSSLQVKHLMAELTDTRWSSVTESKAEGITRELLILSQHVSHTWLGSSDWRGNTALELRTGNQEHNEWNVDLVICILKIKYNIIIKV